MSIELVMPSNHLSQFSFSAAGVVLFNIRYIISLPLPRAFLGGSVGKESTCIVGALASIPGLGRSPGEGKDYPLQYSGLENSMDCIVHGVAKSQTQLSNLHFHTYLDWKLASVITASSPDTFSKQALTFHPWTHFPHSFSSVLCITSFYHKHKL